ncbi:hypothetical protein [Flagellimonas lutaonensis]|uniref:Uncharacterized protein n=1 Tax=Flagellimonas lutaonensis TaxID=516051 RepID=A0A0D5YQP5_9FLAO|nr:hypothetical protein [Allomuricauda lutaonensis]AKA34213.1 hypothetical protein VC82_538 [Allomuricauda lutaonensis]
MALITKKDIEGLDSVHSAFCISIFIPTHRSGKEVLQEKDKLVLKNELKQVKDKLSAQELSQKEVDDLVAPVERLIDDGEFWRHQSDGLALFLTHGFFKKYTLPVYFEAFNHVANGFYLKPLLPMFTGDGAFYVLALQLEQVRLYENTRHTIADVVIDDLIPVRMEERVGYDYEQKSLQFRSQHEGHGAATFHGHAGADRDRENEIVRYFRAIDKGLNTILHDEQKPMVVASQDFLFSLYKKANTYKHLLDEHISCNLSETDKFLLHELAWEKMEPIFDRVRKEKITLFKQHDGTGKTSSDIRQVVPAALQGKIDTLFIENREDIWGVYDPKDQKVKVDEAFGPTNVSLLNMAAIKTFLNGGMVYLLEKEEMPNPHSKVNALYRY